MDKEYRMSLWGWRSCDKILNQLCSGILIVLKDLKNMMEFADIAIGFGDIISERAAPSNNIVLKIFLKK